MLKAQQKAERKAAEKKKAQELVEERDFWQKQNEIDKFVQDT